ncbi:ferredoxin--NADP reductase [Algisphaera agarilytica]|uniref:ferredoxin--NADP(+) reductase n=1 Tax=Algisphaera agarilytica TaxID=1385975 RepID=A0A7X0LKQ4_9BACT|nr:ferredoxin--NADP reductase [Algisphaera agarilytica]MBB6430094.1 ferredoxin--NADP+ reductase [Algisphaera agarilytica]
MPKDIHNATLVERIHSHEDLAFFRVKYNDHDVPDFEPGQFATLGLPDTSPPDPDKPVRPGRGPKLIRRAYSIASPATQKDTLEFYIVRVEDGQLTPSLWDIEPGQTLFMNEKIGGHFTLPSPTLEDGSPDPRRTFVMVGTGTGLAPFRSMYLTHRGTASGGRWDKFILFDGCRLARDLGYHDELTQLAEEDDSFVYLPTVTREPDDSDWPGLRGRVNTLLEPDKFQELTGTPLSPDACNVFLCGNPQMIDQVEADLSDRGFVTHDRKHPDGNLHFERYW